MFERFTDRARRVVVLAQDEAKALDHPYIGTEHILLGLVHEGEGVAAMALRSFDLSLDQIREEVEGIVGRDQKVVPGHIPFTPRAKKVLELSLREALQLSHNYIGTEHILLGLLREGEGTAAAVLAKLGVTNLNRVREKVLEILNPPGPDARRVTIKLSSQGLDESVLSLEVSDGEPVLALQSFTWTGKDGVERDYDIDWPSFTATEKSAIPEAIKEE